MKSIRASLTLVFVLLIAFPSMAQAKKPLSPPATADGSVGGVTITVDYSAPSKRGREIMGGLVPFDEVWRTGANAATTLKTSGDIMLGSLHVPAGEYTLFTIPGEKEWTLIVNKETGQWGTNYDESQDLGRVPMNIESIDEVVETFVISIDGGKEKKGALMLTWENTVASVPIMVH